MSTKLYIGGLAYSVTDDELAAAFAAVGAVTSAVVIKDRETGRSRGFGFVEMETPELAAKAIEDMNEQEVSGRKILVSEARPQENR